MATLTFPGTAVLELLAHAKAAPEHSAGYLSDPKPGPGLLFVKDSGIYLMSNGKPGLSTGDGKPGNKTVYATGYEPAKMIEKQGGDWDAQYDKIVDAAGGDDFVEFLPASTFERLQSDGMVKIRLTATQLMIDVVPPPTPKGKKK